MAKWRMVSGRWQAIQLPRESLRASARASARTSAAPPTPRRGAAKKQASGSKSAEADHVEVVMLTAPSIKGGRRSTVVPPPSVSATEIDCQPAALSRRQSSRRSCVEPAEVPPSVLATAASSQSVAISSQSSRRSSRRSCAEPVDVPMEAADAGERPALALARSESSMGVQAGALSKRQSSRRSVVESADVPMALSKRQSSRRSCAEPVDVPMEAADAGERPALALAQSESSVGAQASALSKRPSSRRSLVEPAAVGRPPPIMAKRASVKRAHESEPVAGPEEPPVLQKRSSTARKSSSAAELERRPSKRLARDGSSFGSSYAWAARNSERAAAPASLSRRESSTGLTPLLRGSSLGAASFDEEDEEASEAVDEAASEAASEAEPTRRSSRRSSVPPPLPAHAAAAQTSAAPSAAPPLRFPPPPRFPAPPRNARGGGGGGGGVVRTPRGGGGPAPTPSSYAFPEPPMPKTALHAAVRAPRQRRRSTRSTRAPRSSEPPQHPTRRRVAQRCPFIPHAPQRSRWPSNACSPLLHRYGGRKYHRTWCIMEASRTRTALTPSLRPGGGCKWEPRPFTPPVAPAWPAALPLAPR